MQNVMTEAHPGGADDRGSYCLFNVGWVVAEFRRRLLVHIQASRSVPEKAKMTTRLTSIASNGELAQRVQCSLKSMLEIPPRMLVSPKGTTSASNPEGRIKPARFRRVTLLQRPAIARLASFALIQLALLKFAPSLRTIPLEQPVDASSLP